MEPRKGPGLRHEYINFAEIKCWSDVGLLISEPSGDHCGLDGKLKDRKGGRRARQHAHGERGKDAHAAVRARSDLQRSRALSSADSAAVREQRSKATVQPSTQPCNRQCNGQQGSVMA